MVDFGKWYVKSKFKDVEADWPPQILNLELTNKCNLKCDMCPVPDLEVEKGFMDVDLFMDLIDQIEGYDDILVRFHVGGESLLHPEFGEMVKYAGGKCSRFTISTNGTLLTEGKAEIVSNVFDKVIFSKPYKAIDNIKIFNRVRNGKSLTTYAQMLVDDYIPLEEAERFEEKFGNLVDELEFRSAHSWAGQVGEPNLGGRFIPCKALWSELTVKQSGKVVSCCMDLNETMALSDVREESLKDIWNNEEFKELRKSHIEGDPDGLCVDCEMCHWRFSL